LTKKLPTGTVLRMKTFIKFFKGMPKEERKLFALSCGTSVGYIFKIIHSKNLYFGPILSRKIEEKSNGIVSRKELRPHDWQEWWPELVEQSGSASEKVA
jgi:hypothetical protein